MTASHAERHRPVDRHPHPDLPREGETHQSSEALAKERAIFGDAGLTLANDVLSLFLSLKELALSDPAALANDCEARARVRQEALAEVTRVGVRLAQALEPAVENLGKTAAPITPEAAEKLGKAYHLVARSVRLNVGLEDEIDQPAEVRERLLLAKAAKLEAEAARVQAELARGPTAEDDQRVALRRAQVTSAVQSIITAETRGDPSRFHALNGAFNHRLERDAADRDRFLAVPFGELVARACKALGLSPDWTRWDEPWALEAEQADLTPLRERLAAMREARSVAPAQPDAAIKALHPAPP